MESLDATKLSESAAALLLEWWGYVAEWVVSPKFYYQLAAIGGAITVAFFLAAFLRRSVPLLHAEPAEGAFYYIRSLIYKLRVLLFAVLNIALLGVAVEVSESLVDQSWLIRLARGLAVVFLLYTIISKFIETTAVRTFARWVIVPLATLQVFGWLDDLVVYLESISFSAGNISISLYGILRTILFGAVLFWLGRVSNVAGKQAIRKQEALDLGTREVFAKVFEIVLFVAIFLVLLQITGLDLTALAVFGGALGVGLGFGLQQIASNFISGFIILLDRSISIGDFIELDDGRSGTLRELNMRNGILETFDGKDILVPNEQFITSTFTNWTHQDGEQRYDLEFQVAYSTDLDVLFPLVKELVASHEQVLSGPEYGVAIQPDAEIASFGDSGINILVEFWISGIDEGKNRIGADLLYMIWKMLRENDIEIPFPQREVRILNSGSISEALANKSS